MAGSFKLPAITFGDALSQAWLAARGLDAFVKQEERMDLPSLSWSNRWIFYRLSPHAGVVSHAPDANIRTVCSRHVVVRVVGLVAQRQGAG